MHRTQIMLSDTQYAHLQEESTKSGLSLAELIRRALDQYYAPLTDAERLQLLDSAFGSWADGDQEENGEQYVERIRSGTVRRLRGDG